MVLLCNLYVGSGEAWMGTPSMVGDKIQSTGILTNCLKGGGGRDLMNR